MHDARVRAAKWRQTGSPERLALAARRALLHYCVENIPTMVPRTASVALSHTLTPFLALILSRGIEDALASEPVLAQAVNIRDGRVVLPALQMGLIS